MSDSLEAWAKERAEARAQVREQEARAMDIANVMETLDVSVDRAMDVLRIPESERETYTALMQTRV